MTRLKMKLTAILSAFLWMMLAFNANAQQIPDADSVPMLLTDIRIQIECTEGVNKMYNYEFDYAESQFKWFKRKYPKHPLPYFLLGLSQWWKIIPDVEGITRYDASFLSYMDSSIYFAQKMYDKNPKNAEATFFLSAAYSFKGRLHAERSNWTKSTFACKKGLDFLEMNRGNSDLSPEFLFGDGLYNYYSIWLRENYKSLRPILMFFDKGDKALGLKQLQQVANEAFYTKTEAQMYLMRIYEIDEEQSEKAFPIAQYLYESYPNNPYFHRFYARMLYTKGDFAQMKTVSELILDRIDKKVFGYEETSGRYAAFYLANYYKSVGNDKEKSKQLFIKAVEYAEIKKATDSGYYHYSLAQVARLMKSDKDYQGAKKYYEKLDEYTERKDPLNKEADEYLKNLKKGKYK